MKVIWTAAFPPGVRTLRATGQAGKAARRRAAKMTNEEAYQILGLQPGASRDDISRAHRTLMKKLHPDQGARRTLRPVSTRPRTLCFARISNSGYATNATAESCLPFLIDAPSACRCPAWPIVVSGKLNRKILTRSFHGWRRGADARDCCAAAVQQRAGAGGAGPLKSVETFDQLRTVMQEISARFSVLQAASA